MRKLKVKMATKRPPVSANYSGTHSLRHFYASWCINRRADFVLELPAKVVQAPARSRLDCDDARTPMATCSRAATMAPSWRRRNVRCGLERDTDATKRHHSLLKRLTYLIENPHPCRSIICRALLKVKFTASS